MIQDIDVQSPNKLKNDKKLDIEHLNDSKGINLNSKNNIQNEENFDFVNSP